MTTANTKTHVKTPPIPDDFILPDPPPKHPDDMTSFKHLTATGRVRDLALHLGNPDITIVSGELYVVRGVTRYMAGSFYPDLLVAFDVDPVAYEERNGYIIPEQGKPPDFVLEIASRHSGRRDTGRKRLGYAELGIPEYWRFDETGQFHGAKLAGDALVDGRYQPIPLRELDNGALEGYSAKLDLRLRWDNGRLLLIDPNTNQPIASHESERNRANSERARAQREQVRANAAEAHIRQLQERLRQHGITE